MKNVGIIFISILLILSSCVKSSITTFELSNRTAVNCNVIFYLASKMESYTVLANSNISTNKKIIIEGGTRKDIYFEIIEDSVIIEFDNNKTVKYYKSMGSKDVKSIYKEEYWEKEEVSKRNYKYTFPITE